MFKDASDDKNVEEDFSWDSSDNEAENVTVGNSDSEPMSVATAEATMKPEDGLSGAGSLEDAKVTPKLDDVAEPTPKLDDAAKDTLDDAAKVIPTLLEPDILDSKEIDSMAHSAPLDSQPTLIKGAEPRSQDSDGAELVEIKSKSSLDYEIVNKTPSLDSGSIKGEEGGKTLNIMADVPSKLGDTNIASDDKEEDDDDGWGWGDD